VSAARHPGDLTATLTPFVPASDEAGNPLVQHHRVEGFELASGHVLPHARLGFCVFGEDPQNPVVVLHPALTGSPKAAITGRATQGDGWFNHCVGPKKFLDTERLTVVCVDHLGGNGASTGAQELGAHLEYVTFADTVRLAARTLKDRGVGRVHAVVGGSIGGGQVFEWLSQDDVAVERLIDLSGNPCRQGPAVEFFQLHADLLLGDGANVPEVKRRLVENCRDLLSRTPAFDRVFEYVIGQLDDLGRDFDRTQALRVARKIGFLRFVTPYFFQRKWDDDYRRWTDEALALAGTYSWIDAQGEKFIHRFSAEALASLCGMEARCQVQDAREVAEQLRRRRCTLIGFSVSGDTLFDAESMFRYYESVRDELPPEQRHLVDVFFAYDELNGHDHFLTPRFLENVPRLAKHLYAGEVVEGFETRAIHTGQDFREDTGALIPPIYLTSTFERGNRQGFDYTRSGNPNFVNLENVIASLEDSLYATVFANGVAAITAVVSTLKSGDLVIAEEVIYGCTYRLFEQVFAKFGVTVEYYDFTDPRTYARILEKRPALVWVESPTNPLLKIIDIRELSKYAARAGSVLCVDNTFASSFCQKPLDLGADLSLSSTTKYINGHSDCLGGVVCTNAKGWKERMVFAQKALGLNPSPFDSWLITRGVKTLSLRMQQHQANALKIAEFLAGLPVVRFVRYPFLPKDPGYTVARAQMTGGSGIVTAQLDLPLEKVSVFLNSLERFTLAESLGGIESLVCHPATMSHASVPKGQREHLGITDSLIRFSVGIEHADDLIADIRQALTEVGVRI
jgi:cystathionine gamma-synthase